MLLVTIQFRDGTTQAIAVSEIRVTAKTLTIERRGKTYRVSQEHGSMWRPSTGLQAAAGLPNQPWLSFLIGNDKG